MKYCSKCGKRLKKDDILCSGCGTKADIIEIHQSYRKKVSGKLTDTVDIPKQKRRKDLLTILMIIGIIILSLFLIMIIAYIWQGFIDASCI